MYHKIFSWALHQGKYRSPTCSLRTWLHPAIRIANPRHTHSRATRAPRWLRSYPAGKDSAIRQPFARWCCHGVLAIYLGYFAPCYAAPQPTAEIDPAMKQALKAAIGSAVSFSDAFEAEVWLLQKATVLEKFVKDKHKRLHLLKEIHQAASHAGLPAEFVLAVIEVESHFNRYAVSVAGAQGIMQVMPFWKKAIGRDSDNLIDLKTNLRYGCAILKYYLDKENGQWATALARYNGSYGKYWYPEKVMTAWHKHWR